MWPFTKKPVAPVVSAYEPSPCGNDEKHNYWTKKGWRCPMCAADAAYKREQEAEDRLARKIADNIVAANEAKRREDEMTVQPWGCHNREIADGYWRSGIAQLGDDPVLTQVNVWIPHNMTKDCRSDSANDERCSGCKWQRKEADQAPLDGSGGLNNV